MIRALAAALALLAAPAAASPGPETPTERLAAVCEAAAASAARAEGVPEGLLRAVSLAETGRSLNGRLRPWPWTVNMEGEGRWFDGPAELLDWVRARRAAGARSFDLGCFQINHLWHGEAFDGLTEMLDPEANALYAARFLRQLREETGSWEEAAGLYHSRTPSRAAGYRARVLKILARLETAGDAPAAPGDAAPPARAPNGAERLRASGTGTVRTLLFSGRGPLLRGGGQALFGGTGPAAPPPAATPASLAGPLLAEGAGPLMPRRAP